jgi:YidC/Oxa1 family membrane protein insertase
MEKRVFLAIALSLLVLTLYQAFLAPPPPKTEPAPAAVTEQQPPAAGTAPASAPAGTGAPAVGASNAAVIPVSPEARDVVVETDSIHAVFSTQGGVLKHWRLKKYLDESKQPLDLIPVQVPESVVKPFSLATDDANVTARIAAAVFQPSAGELSLGANPGSLAFDYQDPQTGLKVHKRFEFQPKSQPYVLNVEAAIEVGGTAKPVTIQLGPSVGLGYNEQGSRFGYPNQIVQERSGKVERPKIADAALTPAAGPFRFVGVGDHYFLSAALPGAQNVTAAFQPVQLPVPWTDPQNRKREFIAYSISTPGAASVPFFLGPKLFDALKAVDVELVRTIDFGMFAFLVVPLLQALKWVNGFIGNYGWSIIALTILINVVLFPLRHRSMVSMRKMQKLQPKVKAIQERYAKYKVTDPERQKMNTEMMALYKEHGVNPASGCVPMLLTLPILFAFYSLLAMSIELRHAPFVGYITDLSRPDMYYITPILMGLSMFWQQRMMPSTADPVQQKMFLFMPLIFTFSFLWAPSGLVLYWLSSNLLAIGQQYLTNRLTGDAR